MIRLRIPREIERAMRASLTQPHRFAAERIGFIYTRLGRLGNGELIILATAYEPVADDHYVNDPSVGARIGSAAIRGVMQRALCTGEGAFHVHIHDHSGATGPSYTDREEIRPLMRSIRNAAPKGAHGLLILSQTSAWAEALVPDSAQFNSIEKISVIGFPMALWAVASVSGCRDDAPTRQSFLGPLADEEFAKCHVGIVGLGGGGSHIAQQLAHVGVLNFSLFDHDLVELSNLNRLVGGTQADARRKAPKTAVAARMVRGLRPHAKIEKIQSRWQDAPERLKACDIIFGCVDSFAERRDLEIATRRYLVPYLDIGLDVHEGGDEPPRMAGQIILSMPGELCMSCLGFLTESKLAREAEQYGAAGPRPQVVWANGVLASTAVGIAVDLLTNWTRSLRGPIYLSYDSNACTLVPHKRLQYLGEKMCPHFPLQQVGDPEFKPL